MGLCIRSNLHPGDVGRIIQLHGQLYGAEHGLDVTFESYVAQGLAEWVNVRTDRDRLWIAERDGQLVACVAIVAASQHEARLRWFLVHPEARGQGLGSRLLTDAINFCRDAGYRSLFLGTFSALASAGKMYKALGFEKVQERAVRQWGVDLVEEWYLLRFEPESSPKAAALNVQR